MSTTTISTIVWTDDLCVGHDEIDGQHRDLIALIGEFAGAVEGGAAATSVPEVLGRLADYVAWHFEAEEFMMRRARYPNMDRHVAGHERLIAALSAVTHHLEKGDRAVPQETLDLLCDWYFGHIRTEDRELARHLDEAKANGL